MSLRNFPPCIVPFPRTTNIRSIAVGVGSNWRLRCATLLLPLILSACQTTPPQPKVAPLRTPVATHAFTLVGERQDVIGELQVTRAHAEDTLSDIARRFNIGYEEIIRANPDVDPWLPREGTPVVLPTQFVLPDAPRSGVVINLAALRLFYFPPRKAGEPQTVITHPIGIGQIGWSTPMGETKVVRKKADPWWYPPASIRKEHAEDGEKLPAKVAPGPDNPLGRYAFTLDWPSYLIHGTNQPYGVGMRASHGCIRLYPEDIAQLFDAVPVGTAVTIVNQPQVYGWRGNTLFMQSYPVFEDYPAGTQPTKKAVAANKKSSAVKTAAKNATGIQAAGYTGVQFDDSTIDRELVAELKKNPRGVAIPVSLQQMSVEKLVAAAPNVENRIPENATWDGVE